MPESRQEKLNDRLFHYARSLVRIQTPSLPVDTPHNSGAQTDQSDGNEEEGPASSNQKPPTLSHLRRKWENLRAYVLGGKKKETTTASPANVNVEALRYLESMVDTLNRRKDELEERRDDVLRQKSKWAAMVESTEGDSDTRESDRRKLIQLNVQLSEVEHKLSFVRFRHSMAEAMLTQIALLDTIQKWEYFYPIGQKKATSELDKHEKRAIIIGCILEKIREEKDYILRDFNTYESFLEQFNIHDRPMHVQYRAFRNSLDKLGLWEKGKEGKSASNLPRIRSNCVQFARRHDWRPDNLDEIYEEVLESLARKL